MKCVTPRQKRQRDKERDRQAVRNRMHFYEFTEVHDGTEKFPYEAIDLAYFIKNEIDKLDDEKNEINQDDKDAWINSK